MQEPVGTHYIPLRGRAHIYINFIPVYIFLLDTVGVIFCTLCVTPLLRDVYVGCYAAIVYIVY